MTVLGTIFIFFVINPRPMSFEYLNCSPAKEDKPRQERKHYLLIEMTGNLETPRVYLIKPSRLTSH